MNTKELIGKHQLSIEILEAIGTFQMLRGSATDNINGFCGTFPELRRMYKHKLIIYEMCIERLKLRYNNLNK